MTETIIPLTNALIAIIVSLNLIIIPKTLFIHPKPLSFAIQNNLYTAIFTSITVKKFFTKPALLHACNLSRPTSTSAAQHKMSFCHFINKIAEFFDRTPS